jgi:hypothetical protein
LAGKIGMRDEFHHVGEIMLVTYLLSMFYLLLNLQEEVQLQLHRLGGFPERAWVSEIE